MAASTLRITKYLNFSELENTGKTKIIGVGNNSGVKLGLIKWMPTWRRYCFAPYDNTIYDVSCLNEISTMINELMEARK